MKNYTVRDALSPAPSHAPARPAEVGWRGTGPAPRLEHDWTPERFTTTVHLATGTTVTVSSDFQAATTSVHPTGVALCPDEDQWLNDVVLSAHSDMLRSALTAA